MNPPGINGHLNGIICINKPAGFTSFDVIAKMRGILRLKRLGHAGTLDPMATGVLPVFAGRATKACGILPDNDKVYEAGFELGLVSDTYDISGNITASGSYAVIGKQDIITALDKYEGEIMQKPPMYSAVQVNGRRLYDLARQGIEIERESRRVTVYGIELLSYNPELGRGRLEISCSKGTYVRSVIHDMGQDLGCGAVMTDLIRTKACGFSLEDCTSLEKLQELASANIPADRYTYPIEKVFSYLPKLVLNEKQEKMYRNGRRLDMNRIDFNVPDAGKVRVCGADGHFIGTAVIINELAELRADKNFDVK